MKPFYPTTSAVHPVSALGFILYVEIQILGSQTETEKKKIASESRYVLVGKSSANVPGTRAQHTNQELRKTLNKEIKLKEFRDEARK